MEKNNLVASTPILPESLCEMDPDISMENLSQKKRIVCKVECWDNNSHVLKVYLGNGIFGIVPEKEISIYPLTIIDGYSPELYYLIGRMICVKFIGLVHNVPVLSRRLNMIDSFETLKDLEGHVINPIIKSSMRTAFFFDCGDGISGMLPVQNYCEARLNNIQDFGHKENDRLKVVIKEVDTENKRLLLSYRELFDDLSSYYSRGDKLRCTVLKRLPNTQDGYFCSINPSTCGILNVPVEMEELKYASTVIAIVRGRNTSNNKLKLRFLSK